MSEHPLVCHPAAPAPWLHRVWVHITPLGGAGLGLTYRLEGELSRLLLPDPGEPRRCDGLWRQTCCELFLAGPGPEGYREFNFSPDLAWQAYDFTGYRSSGRPAAVPAPAIVFDLQHERFELAVRLPAAALPGWPRLRMALALVVQDRQGAHSYWALHHPAPRPDFHHPDSFALQLDCTP